MKTTGAIERASLYDWSHCESNYSGEFTFDCTV